MSNIIILAAIILYLGMVVWIGVICSKKNSDVGDFYLGGRKLGPVVTAMSAEASDMSSYLLMGVPGLAYLTGLADATWTAIGLALGTYLNWLIVAKRLRTYSDVCSAITIPDFFANRYRDPKMLTLISAALIVIFFIPYTASGFAACGKLFNSLLGFDYHAAMIVSAVVIVLYCTMGGFLAASTSDLVQSIIMTFALAVVVIFGIVQAGGMGAVLDNAKALPGYLDMFHTHIAETNTSGDYGFFKIVSTLAWGLGYFGMPHILVRFMSIEKPSMIKKSSIVAIVWVIISLFSAVLIAYLGRMVMGAELLTQGNQKLVFIAMARRFFPAGICGLLLAAIIAASISTADSQLLVASSSFTADLYKPFFRKNASEKETLMVGRILVLILSLIAFGIANSKGSGAQAIMDMVENAWGAFGASFGPTILLSLFWKRFNYQGAVAGVISGFVVDLGWLLTGMTDATGIFEVVPGFFASLLIAVIVAKLTAEPNKKAVEIFDQGIKAETE